MTSTAEGLALDTASAVLEYARAEKRAALVADANVLNAAAIWADQHPVDSIDEAATWPGTQGELALAGEGAPLVAEFCVAELAVAIGVSTDSGRDLIADALEIRHRLPRIWTRIMGGDLPAWRGRRIARTTVGLTRAGADFVDAQLAPFAHKSGPAAVERLVAEATARFEPQHVADVAMHAAERRHVTVSHDQVSFAGTCAIQAELDLVDALDLEGALCREAAALAAAGCEESLDVRRSLALGVIARGEQTLDLDPGEVAGRRPVRAVTLYVHLNEDATTGRVENHRRLTTVDQIKTWCRDGKVTIKPVIDLNVPITHDGYQVPERIAEHVALRDQHCVFPWCTRAARRCDTDHVIPWPRGSTTTDNLAALCRRHHRLKTHSTWTYTILDPGSYLWSSPHGYQFLVDETGTTDVTRTRPPDQ